MSKQRGTTHKPAPDSAPKGVAQSLKEALDHIILAFILAFVFRAFVVEAFVIPTGSMATTLLGAHTNFACRHCGFTFSLSVDQRTGIWPAGIDPICPNSHHKADLLDDSAAPIKRNGDRILVQKYIYNFVKPKRWDVMVFKDPQDGKTNLIKRAIGLPGERVEVIAGDVFINDQIARKSRAAQSALWHLVYENDYQTMDKSWQVRWQGETNSKWTKTGRILEVQPSPDPGADWLSYQDRPDRPAPSDFNEYNGQAKGRRLNAVSDVRLRFIWEPDQSEGALLGMLGDEMEQFEFRYLSDGTVQIARASDGHPLLEGKAPAWKPGKPVRVDFAKADYRLWIALDRDRVLESKDEHYHADAKTASARPGLAYPVIRLGASGASGRVLHLGLDRDVYYTSPKFTEPGVPRTIYNKPGNGTEGNPIVLGADQYFMLGDNSPSSKDSRLWYTKGEHLSARVDYQIGTVPRDQIIGRAYFVYWPAGFQPVATRSMLPFIPNVGNMRLIR